MITKTWVQDEGKAVVVFLREHGDVVVELQIVNDRLEVCAKMSHGRTTSSWDEHTASWPMPDHDDEYTSEELEAICANLNKEGPEA